MSKREPAIPEGERIWLAAIGKHPGWNDHLDDIGLDMDRLVAVKRQIYVDGIGGVIGAGTWESMDESSRDEGFAHSFLWRQPDGLVVGRMWSSSDGKGRRKFPMIVCALCRSMPLSSVAGPVLERLRRLEDRCRQAETAAGVISAVDAMRSELRELASYTPPVTDEPVDGPPAAAVLADAPEMGPDARGLHRVLYQLDREMSAFIPSDVATRSRSRTIEIRAQHMRVPAVLGPEEKCWSVWSRLLLGRLDQLAPILLISKDGRPWLDIIVGEPNPAVLACLQGSPEAFPLTTDIPFTIDGPTAEGFDELIERARRGEIPETDPGYYDISSDRLAPFMRASRRTSAVSVKKSNQILWVSAAAVLVLIVIIMLAFKYFGGTGGANAPPRSEGVEISRAPPRAEPPRENRPAPGLDGVQQPVPRTGDEPAGGEAGDRLSRFRLWCRLADEWYLPFVDSLDTEAVSSDPVLAGTLVDLLRGADRVEPDPLRVAPGRYSSIPALAAHPPAEMGEPRHAKEIDDAIAYIRAVRGTLSPDAWPARGALRRIVDHFGRGVVPGDLSAVLDALEGERGGPVAEAVAALARVHEPVEHLAGALDSIDRSVAALREAGAARRADLLGSVPLAGAAGAGWLEETAEKAGAVSALGVELVEAARNDLPRVDRGLLTRAMAGHENDPPEQSLRAWLEALGDRSLVLLDPSTDPRRALASGADMNEARRRLAALSARQPEDRLAALDARAARWQQEKQGLDDLGWNEANREKITADTERLLADYASILEGLDTIERERRFEADTYLETLRATGSVSVSGSAAVDAVWSSARDGLIERYERDGDLVGLTRRAESVRSALRSIEAAMPPVAPGSIGSAGSALNELLIAQREAMLGEAAAGYDRPDAVEAATAQYARWTSDVSDAVRLARGLVAACDAWTLPGDSFDGSTFAGAIERWGGTPLGGEIGLDRIDPRLAMLADGELSREELVERIRDGAAPPPVVFAAWMRLADADPAWPGDPDELALDADTAAWLESASGVLPGPRRGEVLGIIRDRAVSGWVRAAENAAGWDAFVRLVPVADRLGLDGDRVGPALRFDLFVAGLMARVGGEEPFEVGPVLSGIDDLLAVGPDLDPGARRWLDELRGEIADEQPEVDFRHVGPGRAGWAVERLEAGRRLEYIMAREGSPEIRLGFSLVEPPGMDAVYLCETEAPVSLLVDIVLKGPHAGAVMRSLEPDWAPLADPRRGPHVWTWRRLRRDGRGIGLSPTWETPAHGYRFYAASLTIDPPADDSPLQRVSPEAAAKIAAAVGCRLPRVSEWLAVYDGMDRPGPADEWNLRDRSFRDQRDHMATLAAARWPDDGVFLPAGPELPRGAAAESHDWSDGTLWFDPVSSDGQHLFHHLVGNVAEYVLLDGAPDSMFTDRPADRAAMVAGIAGAEGVGVIGGSALSPPSLPLSKVQPLRGVISKSGFSDVGFRLAFSPGTGAPLSFRVGKLLGSAPFLR